MNSSFQRPSAVGTTVRYEQRYHPSTNNQTNIPLENVRSYDQQRGNPNQSLPTDTDDQHVETSNQHRTNHGLMPSNKDSELFIGDLSFFCTESDIRDMFSQYGEVMKVRIKRNGQTRRTLMYGFVIMSSPDEARRAREALHGIRYMGRDMRVEGSNGQSSTPSPHQQRIAGAKLPDFQIHLAFNKTNHSDRGPLRCDEAFLRGIFESNNFIVKDVAMKEYNAEKMGQQEEGFCFVAFKTLADAELACSIVNGKLIGGYSFTASLSHHNPEKPKKSPVVPPPPQPVVVPPAPVLLPPSQVPAMQVGAHMPWNGTNPQPNVPPYPMTPYYYVYNGPISASAPSSLTAATAVPYLVAPAGPPPPQVPSYPQQIAQPAPVQQMPYQAYYPMQSPQMYVPQQSPMVQFQPYPNPLPPRPSSYPNNAATPGSQQDSRPNYGTYRN